MTKFSEEVTREEIERIFLKHNVCSWWPRFQFSDCKVNIISDLKALFQQKLEDHDKEMFYDICSILEESQQRGEEVINYPELKKRLETLGGRK